MRRRSAYVQKYERIPRRGKIGYEDVDGIDKYESSGYYVMSGSRHAKMNVVYIRKENQIDSVEEQRVLALVTLEGNEQRETALQTGADGAQGETIETGGKGFDSYVYTYYTCRVFLIFY